MQVGAASLHLVGHGVAVAGRAALDDVGDVQAWRLAVGARARELHGCEHLVEQLARCADKGLALHVFLFTRAFAHHQPVQGALGMGLGLGAHAKHRVRALQTQAAGTAFIDAGLELVPPHTAEVHHGGDGHKVVDLGAGHGR